MLARLRHVLLLLNYFQQNNYSFLEEHCETNSFKLKKMNCRSNILRKYCFSPIFCEDDFGYCAQLSNFVILLKLFYN